MRPIEGYGGNTRRFKLFVFLVGNGTSPYLAAEYLTRMGALSDKSQRQLRDLVIKIEKLIQSPKYYYWDMRIGKEVGRTKK